MIPQELHSEVDTESEMKLLFKEQELDEEQYEIREYNLPDFLDSVDGYRSEAVRIEEEGYRNEVNRVETEAVKFLEWFAYEDDVLEASEAEINVGLSDSYAIDVDRAVLVDGVHRDQQVGVDHPVYDTLPQYFTVFGIMDDEKEEAEFYYKTISPEKILSESSSLESSNALRTMSD